MIAVKSDRRSDRHEEDCHEDHGEDSLSEISMKLLKYYPRAASFIVHGSPGMEQGCFLCKNYRHY